MKQDEKEKKIDYHEFEFGEQIDNLNACSTTDCTGLIWRAPKNEDELESYKNVYDFEPPKVGKFKGNDRWRHEGDYGSKK